MVPEGWRKSTLKSLVQTDRKISYGIVQPGDYTEGGIPLIRGKDYSRGWADLSEVFRVSEEIDRPYRRSKVVAGDILLTIVGEYTGNTAIVPPQFSGANITQTTARIAVDEKKADPKFVYFSLSGLPGRREVYRFKKGGAQPGLNISDVEKFSLPLPSRYEQERISKILSTWDRAIEVTERLIANNQSKKSALVQQLLSGRLRLAQFKGLNWNHVAIAQMGKVVTGGTPESSRSAYWGGEINWATPSDITDNNKRFISTTERRITEAGLRASAAKLLPAGSLLVCTRATVGAMSISTSPICTNQGFKSLIPNKHFDVEFLYFLFQFCRHEFIRLACGSTFLEISKRDFEKLRFMVPGLAEQRAIREILSTCENQIDEMRSFREVLLNEKLGLMQQLLTGRRRVRPLEVENG